MKTVSTAFKAAQKAPAAVSVRRVSYKRRYWVQATNSYTWEASWTLLPESEVVSVSPITGKLDTDRLNEFKISNVNLVLKNERRQWKAGKRGGYFGATDTYPYGFEPYWTKFKIESGYDINGTATFTPLFVGVLTGFDTTAASDTVHVDVRGLEALLENANAENISTLVTLENLGTGNGINKDFTTLFNGVGLIKEVAVGGVIQKAGKDFTVSQLNEIKTGAKISFKVSVGSGVAVNATYTFWKNKIYGHDLVKELLTEAGIPGSSQIVSDVAYSFPLYQTRTIDSYLEWADYTSLTLGTGGVTVSESQGDCRIDWTLQGALVRDFTTTGFNGISGTWALSSGRWKATALTGGFALSELSQNYVIGAWKIDVMVGSGVGEFGFFPIGGSYGSFPHNAYEVYGTLNGSGTDTIKMFKRNGTGAATQIGSTSTPSATPIGVWATYTVTRTHSGRFRVYRNGILLIDVTDTSYTSSIRAFLSVSNNTDLFFDNYYQPITLPQGAYVSKVFDLGGTPTNYGPVQISETVGGTLPAGIATDVSDDGSIWEGITDTSGYEIMSSKKRFLKVIVILNGALSSGGETVVHSVGFSAETKTSPIELANFTDKTVYQAIQEIASLYNYEWGFKEDETFFFRSKNADHSIDQAIDSSNNIVDLTNIDDGISRVYSEVQAKYGEFDVTVGDGGVTRDGPTTRYGKRRLSINGGGLLLDPEVDIATGSAREVYNSLKTAKRTMKAKIKLMEWLDLSDTVSVTFNDNIPPRPWFFGDTSAYYGDTTLYFFGDSDQTFKDLICKVVGYRHDTENKTSEFDLEEILV